MQAPAVEDLLQSLRFNTGEHSIGGQRCNQRYEWYQTPSEVVLHIMIPNVKENDILVEFTDKKTLPPPQSRYPARQMSHEMPQNKGGAEDEKSRRTPVDNT
ncbi:Protein SGT1 homolog [Geodia barretti]|uniref:Protein SGT1 homolog n=1 Tax=Geodia barretti TaxID=519541 RepID=A0AA35WJ32_GEOBA|nr:Protein SGT1 homolog [Geodia barretti]